MKRIAASVVLAGLFAGSLANPVGAAQQQYGRTGTTPTYSNISVNQEPGEGCLYLGDDSIWLAPPNGNYGYFNCPPGTTPGMSGMGS